MTVLARDVELKNMVKKWITETMITKKGHLIKWMRGMNRYHGINNHPKV